MGWIKNITGALNEAAAQAERSKAAKDALARDRAAKDPREKDRAAKGRASARMIKGGGVTWDGRVLRMRGRKVRVKEPGAQGYGWTHRQALRNASRPIRGEVLLPAARIATIG